MAEPQDRGATERERRREKIRAHAISAEEGQQQAQLRRLAAEDELRMQRPLEYGVLLTAVGGLAARFADEGFQFVEDYALRLDHVQAIFSPTDSSNEHIRILFQPIGGAQFSAAGITEVFLNLMVAEGSLLWQVSDLSPDERLFSSYEVASDLLLKLTDLSEHAVKLVSNAEQPLSPE